MVFHPVNFLDYTQLFVNGSWVTIWTSTVAFALSLVLGALVALMRLSPLSVIRAVGAVYVEVLRNTPVLVQIFIVYFGLGSIGIRLSALLAGVIALAINAGAYLAEVIRAGLQSVPAGQLEAARSLGLSSTHTFFSVVLPQAFRTVFPPIINQYIDMILASSLLSTIAVNELTSVARIVNGITYETLAIFAFAMLFYLVLTNVVAFAAHVFARRVFKPQVETKFRFRIRRSQKLRVGGDPA
ncbi:amino acid ABC transporter membrane protein 1 (PAAT family) [Paramicrobacterium agarici]|uniref:Amino acid ABC transporter membrane protein 1 (PAAT family) n=1 Tax=Paramicrobacterium agarici TaxID=630514 RepID=A0A2A9DV98_9MICO|nr:amino acid ABC transporter membrane protein 1 (PAAT family) [Microbacterium agarici]